MTEAKELMQVILLGAISLAVIVWIVTLIREWRS